MGWATRYIEELQQGTTVQFWPRGNSMAGKIDSGQLITVQPTGEHQLKVGTIVLCKVGRAQYLHLIKAIRGQQYQIGNNRGGINGWITRKAIYGVMTKIVSREWRSAVRHSRRANAHGQVRTCSRNSVRDTSRICVF